ncbi:Glucan 1,3-beta-glucosidase 3 [Yamadazyma tenuis]|uniref:Glucan 1,3-beta-glucosidase 3 n=1 Tax=Candida tenuis TaxID=2315449 RepID=UPI0027995AE8|nr:Glucan 1,3-beta-glucosidase 3 [Yamadazyma tenuis]
MFDNLKVKSKGSKIEPADPPVSPGAKPTKKQIYQARQNYGVNLGACFVLEKWIYHGLFIDDTAVELEATKKSVKKLGKDDTRKKFEDHWNSFMSDSDWDWLESHQVTSVRIPLGYWEVDGGKYTKNTKFEKYAKDVYKNAWSIFKEKFIEKAGTKGIAVLVDIHGLPGGANGDSHSGEKEGGDAEFWSSQGLQLQVCDMLKFIASDLKKYDNIAGIQVVNESVFSNDTKRQRYYYGAAINSIREADKAIPVVISDGWWPDQWVKWVQEKQSSGNIGVVLDHHCYRCASDDDKKKSPSQIIDGLNNDLLTNLSDNSKGVDIMIGEYSCVLDGQSWDKDNSSSKRDQFVKNFAKRQIELFNERANAGSYFWTFKFEAGSGGEWDFKTMSDNGVIQSPIGFKGKSVPDDRKRDEILDHEFNNHKSYWDNSNKNEKYEHDRFKDGFLTAWSDSKAFAEFNGSVIGRREAWKDARLDEHIKQKGKGKHAIYVSV